MDSASSSLIVITGGSSGIGLGCAKAFAAAGHPLLLLSRHIEPIAELVGAKVRYAPVDVGDYAAVEAAVRGAEDELGGTGCLINSAGFADAREFLEVAPADYRYEIETNLIGSMNAIKAVLAGMVERRAGTIINISSISDRKTSPVAVGYSASKFGLRAVSESIREAEARYGVRVMNIAPGYVKTNIHERMGVTFERYCEILGNPDFMTAEELAGIILYCYQLPVHLCIRDMVVAPTKTTF